MSAPYPYRAYFVYNETLDCYASEELENMSEAGACLEALKKANPQYDYFIDWETI